MRLRSSVRIAIGTYLVLALIGVIVTLLAANARSASGYWSFSRGLGLRQQSLQKGLYPGIAFVVVGMIGAYRCRRSASSHRSRAK